MVVFHSQWIHGENFRFFFTTVYYYLNFTFKCLNSVELLIELRVSLSRENAEFVWEKQFLKFYKIPIYKIILIFKNVVIKCFERKSNFQRFILFKPSELLEIFKETILQISGKSSKCLRYLEFLKMLQLLNVLDRRAAFSCFKVFPFVFIFEHLEIYI